MTTILPPQSPTPSPKPIRLRDRVPCKVMLGIYDRAIANGVPPAEAFRALRHVCIDYAPGHIGSDALADPDGIRSLFYEPTDADPA